MGTSSRWGRGLVLAAWVLGVAPGLARAERELDVGLGYRLARLESARSQSFFLQGISTGVSYFEGEDLGVLLQVEPWFPLDARQANVRINPRDVYDAAWGIDLQLMVAGQWTPFSNLRVTVGGGMHFDGIKMSGAGLREFNHAGFGIGTLAMLRYRLDELWQIGLTASFAIDFIDLAHSDDTNALRWGVLSGVMATFGARWDG